MALLDIVFTEGVVDVILETEVDTVNEPTEIVVSESISTEQTPGTDFSFGTVS